MLRRSGRREQRSGYSIYRRRLERDEFGEWAAVFDLEHPDAAVEADSPDAVCWQGSGQNRSRGELRSGAAQEEQGERSREVLQGALFSDLALSQWDRLRIGGALYELREIQQWPSYRMLYVQKL